MEADQSDLSSIIDSAGPIAGLFVVLLGVALFLLWRSMNRQLRRIDPDLPEGPSATESANGETDQASTTDS